MIKSIQAMINQKKAFMEHGEIIFEDTMSSGIDDLIFLGEDTDDDIEDSVAGTNEHDDHEEDDVESDDDLLDSDIDELPEPVGRQTGEPIEGSIDDLLSVTLDLRNNVISDVLPIPPKNAGDVIDDDILQTRIDTGFEQEDESEDTKEESSNDILNSTITESISLDNDSSSQENNNSDNTDDEKPADEPKEDSPGEENEVTSAVKDKISEIDEPASPPDDKDGKEELLKKLGNLTKSVEDAKSMVMKYIQ